MYGMIKIRAESISNREWASHEVKHAVVCFLIKCYTDRKVSTIKRVYNKRFVANVYDSADTVAGMESSCGTRIVLHSPVVVAVLDILKN